MTLLSLQQALTSLLLAALLAQVIAQVYMRTFRGLSYSRTMVQGVVLGAVVTCVLMLAIGDSIAAGIGLAGGMSIVRFRTTMRDPRDMVFVFASLGIGVVCGLGVYSGAIAGVAVFSLMAILMHHTGYGAQQRFDGLVRFSVPAAANITETLQGALRSHTHHHALVTLRELAQADRMEHAYQVRIPDSQRRVALIRSLEAIEGISDLSLHMQEPTLEL